jgi:hypothetical protein
MDKDEKHFIFVVDAAGGAMYYARLVTEPAHRVRRMASVIVGV